MSRRCPTKYEPHESKQERERRINQKKKIDLKRIKRKDVKENK